MRLSVISDEISEDLDTALSVCDDLGIREVEIREVDGESVVCQDAAGLRRIRRSLEAAGCGCSVIASPFLKTPPDVVGWDVLERSLAAAHAVGADMVRTFSWLRQPDPDRVRQPLLEVLEQARERTLAAGLTLVLENEHACNVATGAEASRVLSALPGPGFGLIWDPGNEARHGSRPYPDGYEAVRDRVLHVHLKDCAGGEWVRIGAGEVDYPGQLRALAQGGYKGSLSVETHYSHPRTGREGATRECVAALRQLAAEIGVALD